MAIDVPIEPMLVVTSGSVGDVTFGHNQFGPWKRDRQIPADPSTALQVTVRTHLTTLATAWNTTLSPAQRDAWHRYATAVDLPGRIGRRNRISGLPAYVRTNVPRLQANELTLPRVDDPPTDQDLAPYTLPSLVVLNIVDQTFHPFFDDSDTWANQTGAAMLFWASPAAALTVNFHKAPYRYAGPLLGSDPFLSSPGTIPLPFAAALNERVFIRARVTLADGRLSQSFRLPADTSSQDAPVPGFATALIPPGRPGLVFIPFDQLIKDQFHSTSNWFVRHANLRYSIIDARTFGSSIRLRIQNPVSDPGIQLVRYTPPPFDVHGLLNGVAVPAFQVRIL